MWLLGSLQTIGTTNGIACLCHSATAKDLLHIYAAYVRGPGFKLVADLASEIQMIRLFHYRGDGLSLPCNFIANVTKVICTINPLNAKLNPICHLQALLGAHHILHDSRVMVKTVTTHNECCINTAGVTFLYLWRRSKWVCCAWWADAIWLNILKFFNVFHFNTYIYLTQTSLRTQATGKAKSQIEADFYRCMSDGHIS